MVSIYHTVIVYHGFRVKRFNDKNMVVQESIFKAKLRIFIHHVELISELFHSKFTLYILSIGWLFSFFFFF